MTFERRLLTKLTGENPFQPATSWWRSIELAVVVRHGLPEGRGLDLGCGDGKLMDILLGAQGGARYLTGVDIDPLETRDAAATGTYVRVHTVPADRIPEPDGSFDFAFSNSVLEHIEDIEPVIREVARLLRPGSRFLFTVPGADFHACLRGPLTPWTRRAAYLEALDRRCAHRRYWSEAQWAQCLARHGLHVTLVQPYLDEGQTRRWETLSRLTAGVLFRLTGQRLQPIEIQRRLRLRRRGLRLPVWLAAGMAWSIAQGVRGRSGRFACLLIEAKRA